MEKVFAASDSALSSAIHFVEEELEKVDCPPGLVIKITVAVEEIFVNIAHYAYPGKNGDICLSVEKSDGGVIIGFRDKGIPFDPLANCDPDVSLPVDERGIGGLGIFMVKKMMDRISYAHKNGENILTLEKKIHI